MPMHIDRFRCDVAVLAGDDARYRFLCSFNNARVGLRFYLQSRFQSRK